MVVWFWIAVGESSGKASRSVAKHIPGPTLEGMNQRATSAASEVSRAHMLMVERGEKLGVLEERSERMRNEAEAFSSSAHQLMLKYKDKKWYQLWGATTGCSSGGLAFCDIWAFVLISRG